MSDPLLMSLAARWADAIARASLEGAVLAGAVWGLARLRPSWPAGWRCTLWWLVCARFLLALAWPAPLVIPILPERWNAAIAWRTVAGSWSGVSFAVGPRASAPAGEDAPAADDPGARLVPQSPSAAAAPRGGLPAFDGRSPDDSRIHGWLVGLAAVWTAFVAIGLSRAAVAWRRERALVRRASPAPPLVAAEASDIARQLGLSREPAVLVSASVAGPCVVAGRPAAVRREARRSGGDARRAGEPLAEERADRLPVRTAGSPAPTRSPRAASARTARAIRAVTGRDFVVGSPGARTTGSPRAARAGGARSAPCPARRQRHDALGSRGPRGRGRRVGLHRP